MKTKKYIIFIFVLFVLVLTPLALRADNGMSQTITIPNPFNCGDSTGATTGCTLLTLLTAILTGIVLPIASVAAVMYVIWAGFKYIQAKGNPAEIQKAHQNLLWALIGVGVVLGATGIAAVLQTTVQSFLTK
jgi:hypothetical protein